MESKRDLHHSEGRSTMRKRIVVLLMATVMVVLGATPALASSSNSGCKAFGHAIAARAHNKDFGMGDLARDTASGPFSYPRRMHLFIYFEKEVYCHSALPG
jgi:hypothetical protein